ncbi:MAG: hypothetical protein JSV49_10590 [Thermoplasmata archaeon]|nr:MAG: hypothetical protein JSV49_10590 [Thermoplasmata archaeon]
MKKVNRANEKSNREVNIEKMNESNSKIFISTRNLTAVSENNRVQNYEDYINDKYLTGAIVRKIKWKKPSSGEEN